MRLSWTRSSCCASSNTVAVNGRTVLAMTDMGSRMSPIKPLGSYEMALDWRGQQAQTCR
jgi:general secretion pathway protein N